MNFNFSTHQDIKTAYKESPQKFSDKEIAEFPQNKVPPKENIVEFFFFTTIFKNKQTKRKSKKKEKEKTCLFIYLNFSFDFFFFFNLRSCHGDCLRKYGLTRLGHDSCSCICYLLVRWSLTPGVAVCRLKTGLQRLKD